MLNIDKKRFRNIARKIPVFLTKIKFIGINDKLEVKISVIVTNISNGFIGAPEVNALPIIETINIKIA